MSNARLPRFSQCLRGTAPDLNVGAVGSDREGNEEVFSASGEPVKDAFDRICDFLAIERLSAPKTRFRRTGSVEIRRDVENFAQLAACLAGTPFSALLAD